MAQPFPPFAMFSNENGAKSLVPGAMMAALVLLLLMATLPAGVTATVSPAPQASLLSDDFTHDTQLNTSLWAINGTAGFNFSGENCRGCSEVPLAPSFSSAGMEIAQVTGDNEIGTIQSISSFSPPFTATVNVKGTVSNGHPFVFGITSLNASAGVQITGNLNPNDCSAEANCGNPSTCGTPANPSIGPNQCFYGIYARIGNPVKNWTKTPPLNLSPSLGLVYALQISVDTSGIAQFNVTQGGQAIGSWNGPVGSGPFYLIIGQSEGDPVPGPGPNQAYWISASVSPTAPPPPSTSASPSSSPFNWTLVLVVVAVLVVLLALIVYRRRRELSVTVIDSESASPVAGAGVWAQGPKNYSGATGRNGRVDFGGVRAGDYSVKAGATGYAPSTPAVVPVRTTTKHTVRLDRIPQGARATGPTPPVPEGPHSPPSPPPMPEALPAPPRPPVVPAQPTAPPAAMNAEESGEAEGWGGERVRQIIQTFRSRGAISPETALTADELGLSRMFVRIMRRRRGKTRVFVEVGGKYYLDENALREMK